MRFIIFPVIGPPVGYLTLLLMTQTGASLGTGSGGPASGAGLGMPVFLFFAYYLGIIPAFIAAVADLVYARRGNSGYRRVLLTARAGFFICLLPLALFLVLGAMHQPWTLMFAIGGLVAGAICSAMTLGLEVASATLFRALR